MLIWRELYQWRKLGEGGTDQRDGRNGWKLLRAVDFSGGRNTAATASGGTPEEVAGQLDEQAREINWYWGKERGTSRRIAWPAHERCHIFGGHGCRLDDGRRPGTKGMPEGGSWSGPPGRGVGGPQGA